MRAVVKQLTSLNARPLSQPAKPFKATVKQPVIDILALTLRVLKPASMLLPNLPLLKHLSRLNHPPLLPHPTQQLGLNIDRVLFQCMVKHYHEVFENGEEKPGWSTKVS
ncbi:hypothetical protein G6F37_008547 [Rhizopus arrhizus]|nr:hypothetical protein G6F37_008547 [Rhizopus arrhizus]